MSRNGEKRSRFALGDPFDLPWWTLPMAVPPLVVLIAALLISRGDQVGRIAVIAGTLAMLWGLFRIALRVESRALQSVYLSAAYAFWVFLVLIWLLLVVGA